MSKYELQYPEHEHPHGPENTKPNEHRIWACTECEHVFTDEELREDFKTCVPYHICKSHPCRKGNRCESHLEPYTPDAASIKVKP
jgi:hypothetical protein